MLLRSTPEAICIQLSQKIGAHRFLLKLKLTPSRVCEARLRIQTTGALCLVHILVPSLGALVVPCVSLCNHDAKFDLRKFFGCHVWRSGWSRPLRDIERWYSVPTADIAAVRDP